MGVGRRDRGCGMELGWVMWVGRMVVWVGSVVWVGRRVWDVVVGQGGGCKVEGGAGGIVRKSSLTGLS